MWQVTSSQGAKAWARTRRLRVSCPNSKYSPGRTFAKLRWYVSIYLEKVDPESIGQAEAGAQDVKYSGFPGAPATAHCSFAVLTAPDRDGYVLHAWNEASSDKTMIAFRKLVSWAQDPSR